MQNIITNQQQKYQQISKQAIMNNNLKSLSFIQYQQGKGYKIDQSALQFLATLPEDDNYAVLTIAGKAKTGKSFLLNQLLQSKDMFPMSSHISNCSKGIMISTKLVQANGLKVIILDSEGFGSLEGNDDRDCKFLILSLLLSSVLLYNSMGTIDQQTLNNFSMIIEVGKMFQKTLQTENSMPALFWVLRDFSLQMQDKNGSPITPKQYLQSALQQQKGNTQIINHKNRIRRVIKSLFTQRSCQTLVLPTQELVSSLTSQRDNLRPEFIQDFAKLKSKLFQLIQKKGCKRINQTKMTISNFINAVQVYVKSLNRSILEGQLPKIQNITFQLREVQAKGCKNKFQIFLNDNKKQIMNEIMKMLKSNQKIQGFEDIKRKFLQPVEKFYELTRNNMQQLTGQLLTDELTQIKQKFYEQLQRQCEQVFKQYQSGQCEEQQVYNICQFLSRISDQNELQQEYAICIKQLKDKNIGKDKTFFSNIMMKVQIAYLRRKLQLTHYLNLQNQKLSLQLEFTKKQLHRVQARNNQIESQLISQIRESRKSSFLTPVKQQGYQQPYKSTVTKEPGMIRKAHESVKKEQSNQKYHRNSVSRVQSSSFFIPYVLIQKPEYIHTRIVRTLIKQDNKRNNYIEYVIDINLLGQKWTVNRKFKDFSQLHSILVMMFQNTNLPDCRAITGPLNYTDFNVSKKQVVEQRRKQLQSYINDLLNSQDIRNSRIVQKFLKINKQYTVL